MSIINDRNVKGVVPRAPQRTPPQDGEKSIIDDDDYIK